MLWHNLIGSKIAGGNFVDSLVTIGPSLVTSMVVNVPAGAEDGDLLIVALTVGNRTIATPSGWTEANTQLNSATGSSLSVFYRFLTEAPPATYTFTASNDTRFVASALAYRNITFVDDTAIQSNAASTDISAPSVTAISEESTLLCVFHRDDSSSAIVSPAGMTERTSGTTDTTRKQTSAELLVGSGDTGVKTATTASGSLESIGFSMVFSTRPESTIQFISHAFTDSGGAFSFTVAKPTGTQLGDFMLAYFFHHNNGVTLTGPSGWTLLTSDNTSTNSAAVYYKRAGASEPSTYGFSSTDDANNGASILTFRGGQREVNVFGAFGTDNSSSVSVPSITPTVDGLNIVFIGAELSPQSVTADPVRFTELFQEGVTPFIAAYAEEYLSSEGATGAESFTLQTAAGHKSIQLQIF